MMLKFLTVESNDTFQNISFAASLVLLNSYVLLTDEPLHVNRNHITRMTAIQEDLLTKAIEQLDRFPNAQQFNLKHE